MSVVISSNLILSAAAGNSLPLTHARIGYHSYLDSAVITASQAGDAGHPVGNITTTQTFERYKSTVLPVTTIDVDLGTAKPVDYIGMVGKKIEAYTLEFSLDDISYTQISALGDPSQVAKMGLFEETEARYWRIAIVGNILSNTFDIANIKLGLTLTMYHAIYGGHTPLNLSRQTVTKPNISEGGEFLGSSTIRKGFSTSYDFKNLPADWYRNEFDPFVEHASEGRTFYVAWRPEKFPLEVGYCLGNSDIAPSNMGTRDLMQVTFNVVGYNAS